MFFRTKNRCCLKDSVKHAYHHLFVKLWTLLQNRRSVEILQFKQVGSALSTFCAKFWCVDLCKSLTVEEITEASHNTFLNPKRCPLSDIPQGYGAMVQFGFKRSIHLPFRDWKRQTLCRIGKDFDIFHADLEPSRRTFFLI